MKFLVVKVVIAVVAVGLAFPNVVAIKNSYSTQQSAVSEQSAMKTEYESSVDTLDALKVQYTEEAGYYTSNYALGSAIAMVANAQVADVQIDYESGDSMHIAEISDLQYAGSGVTRIVYQLNCVSVNDTLNDLLVKNIPMLSIRIDYSKKVITLSVPVISSSVPVPADQNVEEEVGLW